MWANDCQVYSDYLHLEHKRIREVVGGVEQAIRTATSIHDSPQVVPGLGRLRELLVRHFDQEEDGGCLEQAASCCPRLSQTVDRIADEHKRLLDQLDVLIVTARRGLSDADIGEFSRMLREFTDLLDAHDAAENQVLEEAFGTG